MLFVCNFKHVVWAFDLLQSSSGWSKNRLTFYRFLFCAFGIPYALHRVILWGNLSNVILCNVKHVVWAFDLWQSSSGWSKNRLTFYRFLFCAFGNPYALHRVILWGNLSNAIVCNVKHVVWAFDLWQSSSDWSKNRLTFYRFLFCAFGIPYALHRVILWGNLSNAIVCNINHVVNITHNSIR